MWPTLTIIAVAFAIIFYWLFKSEKDRFRRFQGDLWDARDEIKKLEDANKVLIERLCAIQQVAKSAKVKYTLDHNKLPIFKD